MRQKIRLPSITALTDSGKLEQMRSYLYGLVGQLNRLLPDGGEDMQALFTKLQPLIARSADILEAYRQRLKIPYYEVFSPTEDCRLCLRGQGAQTYFIAGMQSGSAVTGSVVCLPDGRYVSQGLSLTAEGETPTLPLKGADRLMILSDRPFTCLPQQEEESL